MTPKLPKPKKCKVCRETFQPTRMIQPTCAKFECQVAYANKAAEKSAQKRKAKESKALREAKESIKTRSQWLKEVQSVFNRWIRLRDAKENCISCGRNHTGQWHAGHYKTVGANPELRFDERNVHKQCAPCNNHLSGNILNYRIGLLRRCGIETVQYLEGSHDPKHYTIDDLKELKAYYQKKCKELEKALNHD
jgi:hypothetical protein